MTVFSSLHPFTIGYEDVFRHFDSLLEHQPASYPPYNIVKTGDYQHCVEVALAGYSKAEVEVIVEEKTLTIKSSDLPTTEKPKDNILHKGIAKRAFKRVFTLADDVVVNDAHLKDGLLKVDLERIVPEEKKPKVIKIK